MTKNQLKRYTVATLASHSCLQILKGAKEEGFSTLALTIPQTTAFYKQFPFIDEVIQLNKYSDIYQCINTLIQKKAIIVPHGSFVAYLGKEEEQSLDLPYFGNKDILAIEGDRQAQNKWLEDAGVKTPKIFNASSDVDRPVIVKLFGAAGGSGYFLANDKLELKRKTDKYLKNKKFIIQEYVIGVPVYFQYFFSLIRDRLEIMGVDRRYETNVDGLGRLPFKIHQELDPEPSFTVIGNFPIVVRESLLPKIQAMGEAVVAESRRLVGEKGLYGAFCLETVIDAKQQLYVIEISCRIVAGTNCYIGGSPYSALYFNKPVSTGRRIAMEIKEAILLNKLQKILD